MQHNQNFVCDKKEVSRWAGGKFMQFGPLHAELNELYFENFNQIGQNLFDFQVFLAQKTWEKLLDRN